jgi:hypothetical protein
MTEDARALAMYLLTCPHGTISGAFRLPDGYVCDDLQWSSERVNATLIELFNKGFANRCETTKWVWIIKHFEWNKPENPNQLKSAKKIAESIPDECGWKQAYMRINAFFLGIEYQPFINPSETLSQPVTVTEAVTEAVTVPVVVCAEKSAPTENKLETEFQSACRQTWKSYSTAYFNRYGTEPVRNAKVNTLVKNAVQRLGLSETPDVVAYYVQSNNSYYVSRGHVLDSLLADCEKLRTEWATGNQMTSTRATQIDKSQANKSAVGEAMKLLGATA